MIDAGLRAPASHAQRRHWAIDRIEGGHAYNMPGAVLVEGPIEEERWVTAFDRVVARHESLRTSFAMEDDTLYQVIREDGPRLQCVDLRANTDPHAAATEFVRDDARAPFDLQEGPLARAFLLRLANDRAVFSCNVHHAVSDQWSQEVLLRDLFALLRDETLPPVPSYREYAHVQQAWLQTPQAATARDYWRSKLGAISPLGLPYDAPRPTELTHDGANVSFEIDGALAAVLEALARNERTTPFHLLTALTRVFFYRLSGQVEFAIGSPIAGRDRAADAGVVGNFINTLVLHDAVDPNESFRTLLARTKAIALEAYEHAAYPFDIIVRDLDVEPDLGRSPLFDVALIYQERDDAPQRTNAMTVTPFDIGNATAKFDLSLYVGPSAHGLRAVFNYNTRLFTTSTIERFARTFVSLAREIAARPDDAIASLEIVGDRERAILDAFNPPPVSFPAATISQIFEETAARATDRVAITTARGNVPYGELRARAHEIATSLQADFGVARGDRVAVLLAPSAECIATLLGILEAGAAYVPLDPVYPADRFAFMLDDSAPRVLVTQGDALAATWPLPVADVERLRGAGAMQPVESQPNDAAYVIYTSGSTGRPKGCVVEHRSVVALLRNERLPFAFGSDDVWILAHSVCFDFSVWEMYGALFYGGRLVVPLREEVRDVERFLELVRSERVSVLNQTPAAFAAFAATEARAHSHDLAEHLRYVIFGGDRLEPAQLQTWVRSYPADRVMLVNMYGITETTVHVTFGLLDDATIARGAASSPIGVPLPQASVYIFNEARRLQPVGVAGEIYVGGAGVCRGYLNRADLNAERFIEHPTRPGERLYKSGDLARWRADGTLEHLGRNDAQVQIRGFRVELGEIAAALRSHRAIAQAHPVAHRDEHANVAITAYVVTRESVESEELRAHVRARVPEYMVPAHIVVLDALPLTLNNKIDEARLPSPQSMRMQAPGGRAPRDPLEQELAALWSRVLDIAVPSIDESYFSLGGDSIKVIRLISRIEAEFGVLLAVKDVFRAPTVAGLASVLRTRRESPQAQDRGVALLEEKRAAIAADPAIGAVHDANCASYYPMSDIEQGMIYHSLLDPSGALYHVQFAFEMDDAFVAEAFERALRALVAKHDILRTSYHQGRESAHVVHREIAMDFAVVQPPDGAARATVERLLEEDRGRPFDPSVPGLWRMRIVPVSGRRIAVVWTHHHAILDGWSNASFLTELIDTYVRLKDDPAFTPPPLRATYRDFVADQLALHDASDSQAFWRDELAEFEKMPLPLGKSATSSALRTRRSKHQVRFGPELSDAVVRLSRSYGVAVREIYLAAFAAWLELVTGKTDVLFGMVAHARPAIEDGDRVLGCFVNSIPVRYRSAGDSPHDRVHGMHERLQQLRPHERLSMRSIARLAGAGGEAGNALFDVLFNFVDFHVLENVDAGILSSAQTLVANESTNTLLDFSIGGTFGEFSLSLYYFESIYSEAEAARLGEYFVRILQAFVDGPNAPLPRNRLLGEEREALIAAASGPRTPYPRDATIVELFAEQARLRADEHAVAGSSTLTYGELDAWSNGVARLLRDECGVQPGDTVAIRMPRSPGAIAAMLGILKAGATYVPIDPDAPERRAQHIVNETGARCTLEERHVERAARCVTAPAEPIDARTPAYIIYTSGSTGAPKGSIVEQRSIVRLVRDTNYIDVRPSDVIAQAGSIAFDACTFEIWGALLNGACLSIVDTQLLGDAQRFACALRDQKITVLFLTTSLFNQFAEADATMFAGLRVLLTGGENASPEHFAMVREACPELDVLHVYGPTENTTFSTFHRVTTPIQRPLPIGKALGNSTAYVLDSALRLLPFGVPGEICVGGNGVARGYVRADGQARDVFVDDPHRPGERLYRSGDLGYVNDNGEIVFLGRIDSQVKVRGFRVEPGEIETVLRMHPAVVDAIVVSHRTSVATTELAAYYTLRASVDVAEIRAYLREELPAHMVPAHLVPLAAMPIGLTGKIDRKKLPPPGAREERSIAGSDPRDEREAMLVQLWCELLGRERVSIHEDYFELGGDSIKSIQMSSRLRQAGWRLEMRALFEHPRIAELAPTLQPLAQGSGAEAFVGRAALGPASRWFFDAHQGNLHHFNMSVRVRAAQRLDEERLRRAIQALWEHHDALRSRFTREEDGIVQVVASQDSAAPFEVADEARASALQERLHLFDGPAFRAALVRGDEADDVVLVMHHAVTDAVSCRILIEYLEHAYSGEPLGSRSDSIASWSQALATYAHTESCASDARYWSEAEGARDAGPCADRPLGSNRYGDCRSFEITFDPVQTDRLLHANAARVEIPSLFLTALAHANGDGPNAVAITLEGHGREPLGELNLSRTVGWFTSLYPFRIECRGGDVRADLLHVDSLLRAVPRKGNAYGIARYLGSPELAASLPPLPRVAFNYLGEFGSGRSALFALAGQAPGAAIDPNLERHNLLDVVALVIDRTLRVSFTYSSAQFDEATIEKFAHAFRSALLAVGDALAMQVHFPGVSDDELSAVLGILQ